MSDKEVSGPLTEKEEIQLMAEAGGLSDAEKAALLDEDDGDLDEGDSDNELETDDDDDLGEGDDLEEGDDAGDDSGDEGDNTSDDDTDGDSDDSDSDKNDDEVPELPAKGDITEPSPIEVADVGDLETKLEGLVGQIKTLKEEFAEGDLTDDEYTEKFEGLLEQRSDLRSDIREAKYDEKRNSERINDRWEAAQDAFYENDANAGFRDSGLMHSALNAEIGRLSTAEKFDGNYTKLLKTAAKAVREQASLLSGKEPKVDEKPKEKTAQDKAKDKKNRNRDKESPKTLKDVPAAETHNEEGKFASLDKLKGRPLEIALSRLSPELQEEWSRD